MNKQAEYKNSIPEAHDYDYYSEYIIDLVKKGGPLELDYIDLDDCIAEVNYDYANGYLSDSDLKQILNSFGDAISETTMQGFVLHKPHGYAGDYEIIDRIYNRYICSEPHLKRWDEYMQSTPAAKAVRARKSYLHDLLDRLHLQETKSKLEILNVASGPGRDMYEYFERAYDTPVYFDCVEQDQNAIRHASLLCDQYSEFIHFKQINALRFSSEKQYDLVWSAGLFDYFTDSTFVTVLKRYLGMVRQGGELVIGNFSSSNPSQHYMNLFQWKLYHRSPQKLRELARRCGIKANNIRVYREPQGVNLFLHVYHI